VDRSITLGSVRRVFGSNGREPEPTDAANQPDAALDPGRSGALGSGALGSPSLGSGPLGSGALGSGALGSGALGSGALGSGPGLGPTEHPGAGLSYARLGRLGRGTLGGGGAIHEPVEPSERAA
jgi:hypothetical protein